MPKILIVEDDKALSRIICDVLTSLHFDADAVYTGTDGIDRLKFYNFDLVILDVDLPDVSGIEVCRTFRSSGGKTPVLILTGKSEITDKEVGFESGADDYLCKPFDMRELIMRVRAAIRRGNAVVNNVLKAGTLELDQAKFMVRRNGTNIDLSRTDFALLQYFMLNPEQVFTAEQLLNRVWSATSDSTVDSLRSSIRRIRKALGEDVDNSCIRNVYGVGYSFTAPDDGGK